MFPIMEAVVGKVRKALGGLALASAAYEQVGARRDAARYPPPGRLVPIGGGRSMHATKMGEGGPTVVIETGAGSSSLAWEGIQRRLAENTTVVTYDRAGYGWSKPGRFPLDTDKVVDDFHALAAAMQLPEPLVLVGHSLGGIYVRAFALRHPEEVGGLVLVDSSHEEQNARMRAALGFSRQLKMMAPLFGTMLAPRGVLRLLRDRGVADRMVQSATSALPAEHREAVAARMFSASLRRTMAGEMLSFAARGRDRIEPRALGRLPIVVITAGQSSRQTASALERELGEAMRPTWLELQAELTLLSSDSRAVMADGATHNVHEDDPDLVTREIAGVVDAVRAGRPVSLSAT